jgi:hypothetical protein
MPICTVVADAFEAVVLARRSDAIDGRCTGRCGDIDGPVGRRDRDWAASLTAADRIHAQKRQRQRSRRRI